MIHLEGRQYRYEEERAHHPEDRGDSGSPAAYSGHSGNDKRPSIFIGNTPLGCSREDVVQLFTEIGEEVSHCEVKPNYAFVNLKNAEANLDSVVGVLQGKSLGDNVLKIERAHGQTKPRQQLDERRAAPPNKTLFVVNFSPETTQEDLISYFSSFGALARVELVKRYAFVEFERLEDAAAAVKGTHSRPFLGATLTVEYSGRREGGRRQGPGRVPHHLQPPAWTGPGPYGYPYPPPPPYGYPPPYPYPPHDPYYDSQRHPEDGHRKTSPSRSDGAAPSPPPHAYPYPHPPPPYYSDRRAPLPPPRSRNTGAPRSRYDRDYRPH